MTPGWERWAQRVAVMTAVCLWSGTSAPVVAAPITTASTLKAAFLYNFAKFIEWPPDALAPGQTLSLCIIGDASVADALNETIQGRRLDSHELTARVVMPSDPLRACHLLYASGFDAQRSTQLFRTLGGAPVFTVGDDGRFTEMGGVAQLILDGDRVRFAVNVAAARRSRLTLSSKLLSLAKIVKDGPDVGR